MPSSELLDFALSRERELLNPFGDTDVLLFYACVSQSLAGTRFLSGKLLAAKNWIPPGSGLRLPFLIKRGSDKPPLFASDLAEEVSVDFLKLRVGKHLSDVRKSLSPKQATIWDYFLPRKLSDFFYATNGEGVGEKIERIFLDLDRGKGVSREQALDATRILLQVIRDDEEFRQFAKKFFKLASPLVVWTGSSFHLFFFLKHPQENKFYLQYFQHEKHSESDFVGKWAQAAAKQVRGFNVVAGHEKQPNSVSIDASQTPSGKLCRVSLGSLHMADARTVDGVSLPVAEKQLSEKSVLKELLSYTPQKLLHELPCLEKLLPKL